jgi:hypothetical protein
MPDNEIVYNLARAIKKLDWGRAAGFLQEEMVNHLNNYRESIFRSTFANRKAG